MNRDANAFMNNLTQAARDNPLAAALVGVGALWLMFGNRALGGIASGVVSVAQPVAEEGMRGALSAADAVASAGRRVTHAVGETARSMTRAASDAVSSYASALTDDAKSSFDRPSKSSEADPYLDEGYASLENGYAGLERGYSSARRSALTDLLEKQPLVLGAVGLAIGASVASAIASTSTEDEWVGPVSDDVKEAAKGRARHVVDSAKRAAGEAVSEFRVAAGGAFDNPSKTSEEPFRPVKEAAEAGREP